MGMFDHVNYSRECYNCGHVLTGWQSKSGPCTMETLEPWQVTNLYTNCPECGAWNEYKVDAEVEVTVKSIEFTNVYDPGCYKREPDVQDNEEAE